ncbi:MAG: FKBP-type peptidyl-prolyl cis-trans isomerase [Chitinophagales bacterium]|nr:FKBP-type peptidyl-prolyl cis-trans isomerase [Bacteroidota bacterium]MCB9043453.1 FKBP-type peptidyl-prolyl cis-trans isomerase [Chitinophagales bacterium]
MKKIFFLVAISFAIMSCKSEGKWVKLENGLEYKIVNPHNGVKAKDGDFVEMQMRYSNPRDSVIFDSFTRNKPLSFKLTPTLFRGALNPGIMEMSAGDSAVFHVPAELIYDKKLPKFIKEGEKITYNIKLISVQSEDEYRKKQEAELMASADPRQKEIDAEAIKKFIADNNLKAEILPSGLAVVVEQAGTSKPEEGSNVTVHYRGKLLDGNQFDASYDRGEPFTFPLGKRRVIRGWDEGIPVLGVGGKGKLIIPSDMAYGPRGVPGIPANSILVFDVEVLDAK